MVNAVECMIVYLPWGELRIYSTQSVTVMLTEENSAQTVARPPSTNLLPSVRARCYSQYNREGQQHQARLRSDSSRVLAAVNVGHHTATEYTHLEFGHYRRQTKVLLSQPHGLGIAAQSTTGETQVSVIYLSVNWSRASECQPGLTRHVGGTANPGWLEGSSRTPCVACTARVTGIKASSAYMASMLEHGVYLQDSGKKSELVSGWVYVATIAGRCNA